MHISIACALAALGACSDAEPTLLDAAPCLIPADYGALGGKTGTADLTAPNTLTIVLDPGPPKDDLFIKLTPGKGAFAGGALTTGTFSISGADATFDGCGLCIDVIADISPGTGPSKFYFADAGTVTLTSATATTSAGPSAIAGTAENLHFIEYDLATQQPVVGGCTATTASVAFGP